ncbi:MAG: hypothetical protein ACREUC_13440, partial [Steroidobacteraceae bacterium]
MRRLIASVELDAFAKQAALLLDQYGSVASSLTEYVSCSGRGVRQRATFDARQCLLDVIARARLDRTPRVLAQRRGDELLSQTRQRIARPFRRNLVVGLLCLRFLAGVSGQSRIEHTLE